ncbi:dihydrolipoamide dehydrogenase [Winogradskyella bathintestinalis]|uniref:Dihydrolipoamide dehydrogenase n=1 Tax=Winogradskyella bathintestinalis TaxID=3035208 RepID=A0ABT7ZVI3_9FLAO|nr:dihydrolipoamide dehydrogenase [Winogradskyella bathintestinalis]MDN3492989.1 dihydrolipoamide dehydrogenase [Winogradskyella bathintestinalis]
MKRILSFITVFALLLTACEGDPGPPGPPGANGVNMVGQSFEKTIDFTSTNNYEQTLEIPQNIELLESDMVLVYHLRGTIDDYDVWKSLPETVYINSGEEFQYNYEHNFDLVTVFIESHPDFDFNLLLDEERISQTFRIVVLPVDFIDSSNLDVNNYNDVMEHVQKID